MGVSGAGKSMIGTMLAHAVGYRFVDADALHSAANIAKMAAGVPLEDSDRWPWLDSVGRVLEEQEATVVACSALRRSYRDRIRSSAPLTAFVHLEGSRELLVHRMSARIGHFMPVTLLDSQLGALEPLQQDERGIVVSIEPTARQVVERVQAALLPVV